MEALTYLLAAPETRVVVSLLGWVCGFLTAGVLALVMSR